MTDWSSSLSRRSRCNGDDIGVSSGEVSVSGVLLAYKKQVLVAYKKSVRKKRFMHHLLGLHFCYITIRQPSSFDL